jgi:hypothetical protein
MYFQAVDLIMRVKCKEKKRRREAGDEIDDGEKMKI